MCVCVCCAFVCISVCVCLCICVCVYMYVYAFVCMFVYVCVYVHVRVCVQLQVYEEIGLDVRGLVQKEWVIERTLMGHSNRMYIIPNIPESTKFATRTRKEISVCVHACVLASVSCMVQCTSNAPSLRLPGCVTVIAKLFPSYISIAHPGFNLLGGEAPPLNTPASPPKYLPIAV